MKLPSDPGQPADVSSELAQASAACSTLDTFSAEIGVSGSLSGQKIRARLLVGLAAPDSARIEAVAPFGPPVFVFVAHNRDATLLLPRDERVLEHGKPADVLDAVTGLPLDAADLRSALTACPSTVTPSGRAIGDQWRVVSSGGEDVYLNREGPAGWHVAALVHTPASGASWRAEYRDFVNGLPRSIRLISAEPRTQKPRTQNPLPTTRFDFRLSLSQVDVNPSLGNEAFRVQIPRGASPITLQELQRARPGVR